MNDGETIADIAAKMRGMVEPGDTITNTYELLNGLANSIEAAAKREREDIELRVTRITRNECRAEQSKELGNAADMREAIDMMSALFANGVICTSYANTPEEMEQIEELYRKAKEALSAPPRNCDRFGGETEAMVAFLNEVWLISVKSLKDDPFDGWTPEMKARYAKWLMEKEGGSK